MQRWEVLVVLLLVQTSLAQFPAGATSIPTCSLSGTVNAYYGGVGSPNAGDMTIQLDLSTARGASSGSSFFSNVYLVMQVQDATFYSQNDVLYGYGPGGCGGSGFLSYGNSGLFELVAVTGQADSGNIRTLTLQSPLLNNYKSYTRSGTADSLGQKKFQVIQVPYCDNIDIAGTVTGNNWNGINGGGVAFFSLVTLTLNSQTIAAPYGFRGGQYLNGAGYFPNSAIGFVFPTLSGTNAFSFWDEAMKGEGICGTPNSISSSDPANGRQGYPGPNPSTSGNTGGDFGKGAPCNAGGGGTQHNGGGGGGGNGGKGGYGANGYGQPNDPLTAPCHQAVAGNPLPADPTRIFLGGGGGSGQVNNNAPYSGGAGGGFVIIYAGGTVGSTTITANGQDAPGSPGINDGGGGGGAGGSVLLISSNLNAWSSTTVSANGGSGQQSASSHGGGGGGGGGIVITTGNAGTININGGLNQCCQLNAPGDAGIAATGCIAGSTVFTATCTLSSYTQPDRCPFSPSSGSCDLSCSDGCSSACADCVADFELAPVTCSATNIHSTGATCATSDPCNDYACSNGICTAVNQPNNTPCDDQNPCTTSDECQAGICVGTQIPGCISTYAITGVSGSPTSLYRITDLATCAITLIGSTGLDHGSAIAIDPTTATLYAYSNSNGALYTLNKATAAPTLIGIIGDHMSALTFDSTGQLYGWAPNGSGGNGLRKINKATGVAIPIGNNNYYQVGISFAPSEILYMRSSNQVYSIDTTTGALVSLFTLDRGGRSNLDWCAPLNAFLAYDGGSLFSFDPTSATPGVTTDLGNCAISNIGDIVSDPCPIDCAGKACGDDNGCGGGCNAPCADDGIVCNGLETCNPSSGCVSGPPFCDDGNPCNGVETCVEPGICSPGIPISCPKIYAITGSGNTVSNLYAITDLASCSMTLLGSTGLSHITGLAIDPTDGNLYAHCNNDDSLYILDRISGVATFVGVVGHQCPDMGFDPTGQLYEWSESGDNLIRVDKTTGAATVITSSLSTSACGMSFKPDGTLYVKPQSSVNIVDTATGNPSFQFNLDQSATNILEWAPALNAFLTYSRGSSRLFTFDPSAGTGITTNLGVCSVSSISAIAIEPCPIDCAGKACGDDNGCGSGCNAPCADDGIVCNGAETCNPSSGCVSGPPFCDDGNPCNGAETCVEPGICSPGTPISCPKLYAITGTGNAVSNLYEITDLATCSMTLLGSTGLSHVTGLAIDPTSGLLYAHTNAGGRGLYLLNRLNGAATLIGNGGIPITDMTLSSTGQFYGWSPYSGALLSINKATGATTSIGGATFSGVGLSFGPNGVLYMKSYQNVYSINTASGAETFLFNLDRSGLVVLEWVPPINAFLSYDGNSLFSFDPFSGTPGLTTDLGNCAVSNIGAIAAEQCTVDCTGKSCGDSDGCGGVCNAPCDDGNACNGVETCNPTSGCVLGTPINCNDGNACNGVETCVDPAGTCSTGIPLLCGTSGCIVGSGCYTPPVISSLSSSSPSPVSILLPVSVNFVLSDPGGESSSITIDWGDGNVDFFPGLYAPATYSLGSHNYGSTGTYCIKVCADDGTGVSTCDAAFLATLVCSKKRAPGGAALSITVSRFSAGGDPYYLGYDGKLFEFHGNAGEVYSLISSVTNSRNIQLNVLFGTGFSNNKLYSMGVVMRSIGLIIDNLKIIFTVHEKGDVEFSLNGIKVSSFRNGTFDGVRYLFEPNIYFSRTALHMSAHDVHHLLTVKTSEIVIHMFGVQYQPQSWKAQYFHFVDLEVNIIDPTFCPDGVWGSTACGGHHDPKIDYRYRIRGDDLLGTELDQRLQP